MAVRLAYTPVIAIMTPAEFVAQRAWSILGRARALDARFGEESLTDLLVLDMLAYQRARSFRLNPTTKHQEAALGADLFVAVRHWTGRWSRLALQAKKLFPSEKYEGLGGRRKCGKQLRKLERCARQLRALPLYLLYNYTTSAQLSQYWRCPMSFTADQLGCTLVPSWHISQLIQCKHPPTFAQAHRVRQSMPWRCAFDCPLAEEKLLQLALPTSPSDTTRTSDAGDTVNPAYDRSFEAQATAWLGRLLRESATELTFEAFDDIRGELSGSDDVSTSGIPQQSASPEEGLLYPSRLLIVDGAEESQQIEADIPYPRTPRWDRTS